jgi:hypothetical protein
MVFWVAESSGFKKTTAAVITAAMITAIAPITATKIEVRSLGAMGSLSGARECLIRN